jgi:hypothetical protein
VNNNKRPVHAQGTGKVWYYCTSGIPMGGGAENGCALAPFPSNICYQQCFMAPPPPPPSPPLPPSPPPPFPPPPPNNGMIHGSPGTAACADVQLCSTTSDWSWALTGVTKAAAPLFDGLSVTPAAP